MIWPWRGNVVAAQLKEAEAEQRGVAADRLVEQSQRSAGALRRELAKNGWTDLLQQAMGGR